MLNKTKNFNPNYCLVVAKVDKLEAHPNADRLQIAIVRGFPCIVGLETKAGDLGILVREGSQLTQDFALGNGLLRKHPVSGEKLSGYMDPNCRVRSVKLRGVESEALFLPIGTVEFPQADVETSDLHLSEGEEFDAFGKTLLCKKFRPSHLREASSETAIKKRKELENFPKHYNTGQVRMNYPNIWAAMKRNPETVVYVTEKLHGTSGRTGIVPVEQPLSWPWRLWNKLVPSSWSKKPKKKLMAVSGTRNCILSEGAEGEKGMDYRMQVHEFFARNLEPGETVYYEIVGYEGSGGRPIMQPHKTDKLKKELGKEQARKIISEVGDALVYEYGCVKDGVELPGPESSATEVPCYKIFLYRLTTVDEDGNISERPFSEVRGLAEELYMPNGMIQAVPVLNVFGEGNLGSP